MARESVSDGHIWEGNAVLVGDVCRVESSLDHGFAAGFECSTSAGLLRQDRVFRESYLRIVIYRALKCLDVDDFTRSAISLAK